ncbi:MAG TPA: hypothetical protein VMH92_11665 [Acidocella sp.]|nr:hypothetical protein [Acidocella sp.]
MTVIIHTSSSTRRSQASLPAPSLFSNCRAKPESQVNKLKNMGFLMQARGAAEVFPNGGRRLQSDFRMPGWPRGAFCAACAFGFPNAQLRHNPKSRTAWSWFVSSIKTIPGRQGWNAPCLEKR